VTRWPSATPWAQVTTWSGLDSAYGRTVLVKVGAFVALVAIGALNLRLLRPRLASDEQAERRLRGAVRVEIALVLLIAVAVVPVSHLRAAGRVPPIHDITTDLDDPPRFVAVLPHREGAPNTAEHGGAALAAQQRAGYPDLGPARFTAPPERVFARAVDVARGLGWEIVAAVPAEGRLEATDRTRWFGFRDDVVVRVRPDGTGSRVDVRSVSRVGRSDLGTNARRIRAFLDSLPAGL